MPEHNLLHDPEALREFGVDVLRLEAAAIAGLAAQLDGAKLQRALVRVYECQGTVMVVGSGTSGSIARRLAHILTCSGSPAMYLDPGQARHGYSGVLRASDVLIVFSRGGETDEINELLEVAVKRKAFMIGVTEVPESTMAEMCDVVLAAQVPSDASAVDVIPLASTLGHAAVGDILCAAILTIRGFDESEFANLHPGGAVGKRLREDTGA